jgi:ABC-type antimicrobial peptide transport system permease subunit
MNLRKLIKVNIVNLVILALIVLFRLVAGLLFNDHDEAGSTMVLAINIITVLFGLFWAAFTVYSNMTVVKEEKIEKKKEIADLKARLTRAGNKKYFVNERRILLNILDSLQSREKYIYMMDKDSKILELFQLTRNQITRDITNVSEYIETYDYYSGKDSGYVQSICNNSQHLMDKFNKLIELTVTYDDTSLDYDTREIDDMIEALEKMRETGKGALGS